MGFTLFADAFSLPKTEKENLALIRQLEDFAENELGLNLKRKFYKKWQKQDQQLTYVYVSRPDSILLPPNKSPFKYFGLDTAGAKKLASEYTDEGDDAMVYNTSGTSATLLTHHLLNYPQEAIIFIVLHEMAHVHREKLKLKIPYPAEESYGEFLGNYGGLKFTEKYHPHLVEAVLKQKLTQEKIYKLLFEAEAQTQGVNAEIKQKRYSEINSACQSILNNANVFQKERYNYTVNHAYILRNRYYYKWYFQFEKIFKSGKSLTEMTELYSNLPENDGEADTFLKQEIKKLKL
jgi:hypothetical protein